MPPKSNKSGKFRKTEEFKQIQESMMQYVGGEYAQAHDIDLVKTHMDLWCHLQMLIEDVNDRGVYVEYNNGGGQKGTKRNESLQDELKVTAQLLNIRNALGIKDAVPGMGDDDKL